MTHDAYAVRLKTAAAISSIKLLVHKIVFANCRWGLSIKQQRIEVHDRQVLVKLHL